MCNAACGQGFVRSGAVNRSTIWSTLRPTAETVTDGNGQFTVPVPQSGDGVYYAVARKGSTIELAAVLGTVMPASCS